MAQGESELGTGNRVSGRSASQVNFAVNPEPASTPHPPSTLPSTPSHSTPAFPTTAVHDRASSFGSTSPKTGGSPRNFARNATNCDDPSQNATPTPTNLRGNLGGLITPTPTPGYSTEAVVTATKPGANSCTSSYNPQHASPKETDLPLAGTSSSALTRDGAMVPRRA